MEPQQPRYHAIDHLRATMISIVVFGHALLPYTTIPRSFKDPETHIGFDVVAIFLYSFAMPVFFVTAGFSTALIFYRKGVRGLARSRFLRIFVPLLVAYLALTPLTRLAYGFAKQTVSSGSLQAGLDALSAGNWLVWGKAYHLWFLVSLLIYSAIAVWMRWGLLQIGISNRVRAASRYLLTSRWRATLLTLVVAATMVPAYVFYGADATTFPMQLALISFFLLGWAIYLHRDLLPALQERPWQPIVVSLMVLPLAVWSTRARLMALDDPQLLAGFLAGLANSILATCMTMGLLGVFQARYNQPSTFGRYVSDASYWLFLIHYPLLIAVAGVLTVTALPATVKYLVTLGVVVPAVVLTYHFTVRSTRLGRVLSGGRSGAKRST